MSAMYATAALLVSQHNRVGRRDLPNHITTHCPRCGEPAAFSIAGAVEHDECTLSLRFRCGTTAEQVMTRLPGPVRRFAYGDVVLGASVCREAAD